MTCLDPKEPEIPVVIQGEDEVLTIQLENKKKPGEFIDITGATEIIALFGKTDTTVLQQKLTESKIVVLSALAGKFQVILSAAETALLALTPQGERSSIEIRLTIASKLTIIKLEDSFVVEAKLFPSV